MTEAHPLALSLFDFVPNIAFLVGAYYLVHLALLVRGRSCTLRLTGGAPLVFLCGSMKALLTVARRWTEEVITLCE